MARVSGKVTSRVLLTIAFFFTALLFVSHPIHRRDASPRAETQRDFFGRPQPGNNNVFFFEPSCARDRLDFLNDNDTRLRLDITQACALESAARTNPEMNVFLFSSCPLDENSLAKSSRMVQEIFGTNRNVFFWHQSLESLLQDTGLEDFLRSGKMFDTSLKKKQSSSVVKVVLLKKFGGTYLDLDFILRRPLSLLANNFACVESSDRINDAALRFGMDDVGRKVANMFVKQIKETFNGKIWKNNGPLLTTRVVKKLCKFQKVVPRSASECDGFAIYDHPVFYPVHRSRWKSMYADKWLAPVLKETANSTGVHLWSSMVRLEKTHEFPKQFRDSKQPKIVLQRMFCPIAHSYNTVK